MYVCVCIYIYACSVASVVSNSATPGTGAHQLLCLRDFPGKNTEVGQHALLQEIFLTQGPNPHLCTAGRFFIAEPPGKTIYLYIIHYIFIYIFPYFLVNWRQHALKCQYPGPSKSPGPRTGAPAGKVRL